MGGESIYKFDQVTDEEIGIFQSLSKNNTHVMLQSFLPKYMMEILEFLSFTVKSAQLLWLAFLKKEALKVT